MLADTLSRGEVDIWIAEPGAIENPTLYAAYDALLTECERARQSAFVFEENRREGLVARALVRTRLSRYRPVAPAHWRFTQNPYGRPQLEPACGLSFSLSHHPTMVVCAVTEDAEIGVDVEPTCRGPAIVGLARSVFGGFEHAELMRLDERERFDRATSLWTLKESYVKARGKGLTIPLRSFAFHIDDAEGVIEFDPPWDDVRDRWWFRSMVVAGHRIALTVERTSSTPPVVRLRRCVPLSAEDW